MLLDDIKKDMFNAKKEKDSFKSNLLSALYSEIYILSKSGKELTDEDSVKMIKKFIKNIDETLALDIPEASRKKYQSEKTILETYLPKQLPADEVEKIVSELHSQGKNMKDIMAHFKENFQGQYDGRTVSESVKRKQSG
jgi:uncharacterized protein